MLKISSRNHTAATYAWNQSPIALDLEVYQMIILPGEHPRGPALKVFCKQTSPKLMAIAQIWNPPSAMASLANRISGEIIGSLW